ncbi:putative FMN-binding domain-domain-containing protein [Clohesyomyces aquaticus]|uniref:Putative FMN-binding domain-domain-containing protein n=1 Tax=Clohesyomyces aquaticus TaxID=1231657 RepID=A0A1Y1Z391_9PLEO|nr:putative FMN-binding domain-domain-containing protein [Clohesyomyces aquaticus]
MYLRTIHAEHNVSALQQFIRSNPLGIFTTAIESKTFPFLQSSHIPFVLDVDNTSSGTHLGVLRGHLARANPQAKALIEHLKPQVENEEGSLKPGPRTLSRDVLVLFNGPAHHYVYGRATIFYETKDSTTDAFLVKQIRDLSMQAEVDIMGHKENPWQVEDAPTSYVELLKKAIIGVEIEVTDIGGKFKMSQELAVGDRGGVVEGFEGLGSDVRKWMAENVRERGSMVGKVDA